jgi:RNA polymerase sporulation-specific sigma factor
MSVGTSVGELDSGVVLVVRSDEELVVRAHGGDEAALLELLERYRRFARAKARSYFLVGGDHEDVVQEAMIGLYKAVRDFQPDHDASFRTFAEICVTRQILSAVKAANRQKHAALNRSVSLDHPADADDGRSLGETVPDEASDDPLRHALASDELRRLREMVSDVLSDLETEVLDLYVEGRSYQEIAEALGRHVKSIDNALQRIKRKLEHHLHEVGAALT